MGQIGYGYGSEWHLLRYLGRHRRELNRGVEKQIASTEGDPGFRVADWLDFDFDRSKRFLDRELVGVNFLDDGHPARIAWQNFWPRTRRPEHQPNWDAIAVT